MSKPSFLAPVFSSPLIRGKDFLTGDVLTLSDILICAPMKFWEIIAENLSKAGWSWGCVSAVDSNGRTIWIADAHRDNEKRLVVYSEAELARSASQKILKSSPSWLFLPTALSFVVVSVVLFLVFPLFRDFLLFVDIFLLHH